MSHGPTCSRCRAYLPDGQERAIVCEPCLLALSEQARRRMREQFLNESAAAAARRSVEASS